MPHNSSLPKREIISSSSERNRLLIQSKGGIPIIDIIVDEEKENESD